jgi:hypothetical protein
VVARCPDDLDDLRDREGELMKARVTLMGGDELELDAREISFMTYGELKIEHTELEFRVVDVEPALPLPGTPPLRVRDVSDAAYRKILETLGNHAYAGITTLAGETTYAHSHVARAMTIAVERGHADREVVRRGKYRFRLTESGLEFVTAELCQEGPVEWDTNRAFDMSEPGQ